MMKVEVKTSKVKTSKEKVKNEFEIEGEKLKNR